MNKIWNALSVGLTALVTCLLMAVPALASNGANFQVSPVLPDNQRPGVGGYFDLLAEPGAEQSLSVEILNTGSEEIVVEVEAVTASTNRNGVVNYTTQGENDSSLSHSIADLIQVEEEEIAIPANSSRTATIQVRLPEEAYPGYLLGSIHIKKRLTQEEKDSGQTILNQFSYVVALKVAVNDSPVANDFRMDRVQATLVNGRASIVNPIVNPQPILVKGMTTRVKIIPRGASEPVMERVMEDTDMAPNSIFPFVLVDDAGYGIRAGSYVSQVEIAYGGQVWSFEEEFEIKAEEAAAINTNAVNQGTMQTAADQGNYNTATIILILLIALLPVIAVVLLYLVRKTKKADNGLA